MRSFRISKRTTVVVAALASPSFAFVPRPSWSVRDASSAASTATTTNNINNNRYTLFIIAASASDDDDDDDVRRLMAARSRYLEASDHERVESISRFLESKHGVVVTEDDNGGGAKKETKTTTKPVKTGYARVGGPSLCDWSDEDVAGLLRDRTRARRARDFGRADAVLRTLNEGGVEVDDAAKEWRADGDLFGARYRREGPAGDDDDEVAGRVTARARARSRGDYETADDLGDELRYYHDVEVDDEARAWRRQQTTRPRTDRTPYEFGGRRTIGASDEEFGIVTNLVDERDAARRNRDFDRADAVLKELLNEHGVRVDDRRRLWHFDHKHRRVNPAHDGRDDRRREDDALRTKKKKKSKSNLPPEITVLPGGISMPDDQEMPMPDGISFAGDDEFGVPEGVSLPDGISLAGDDEFGVPEGVSLPDGISLDNSDDDDDKDDSSRNDLMSLTVPDLKARLRDAGLPVSGRKAELVDRLLATENK